LGHLIKTTVSSLLKDQRQYWNEEIHIYFGNSCAASIVETSDGTNPAG
jgi:hypothetical protein